MAYAFIKLELVTALRCGQLFMKVLLRSIRVQVNQAGKSEVDLFDKCE